MANNSQSNRLPIFGRDIVDDWSWDREEEKMREKHDFDEEPASESKTLKVEE